MNPRIGIFGKLPIAGDFVAVNAANPAGRAFDQWLRNAVDNLNARRRPLPPHPARFLFRDARGTGACIGVMAPSRDKVGRPFPICIFSYVDMPVATHRFSSLPAAYAPFLDGAARLLGAADRLDAAALASHCEALLLPGPDDLEEARVWEVESLQATGGATLLEALFGPLSGGVQYHGLNLFKEATKRFAGGDPGNAAVILECPASDDVQLVFWLRAAYQRLAWRRAPPSFVWSAADSRDSRLLLVLGSPDASVLHFLADPSAAAERLWPMRTASMAAIQSGRAGLGTGLLQALEPPAPTAAHILAALT